MYAEEKWGGSKSSGVALGEFEPAANKEHRYLDNSITPMASKHEAVSEVPLL